MYYNNFVALHSTLKHINILNDESNLVGLQKIEVNKNMNAMDSEFEKWSCN